MLEEDQNAEWLTVMSTGKIETNICEILSQSVMPIHSNRLEVSYRGLLGGIVLALILVTALRGYAATEDLNLEKIDPDLREGLLSAESTDTFVVWIVFIDRPSWDDNPYDRLPPVEQDYVARVSSVPGVQPRHVDELLNALSVEATARVIYDIAALPFVFQIQPVPVDCVLPEGCEEPRGEAQSVPATLLLPVFAGLAVGVLAVSIRQLHHRGKDN